MPDLSLSPAVPSATWSPSDIATAAFRMHALGMSERETALVLRTLAARGVRNLGAYTRQWTEADATEWKAHVGQVEADAERLAGGLHFADPLIRGLRRRVTRWPWRVAT